MILQCDDSKTDHYGTGYTPSSTPNFPYGTSCACIIFQYASPKFRNTFGRTHSESVRNEKAPARTFLVYLHFLRLYQRHTLGAFILCNILVLNKYTTSKYSRT